jgi:hypothetical protein
MRGFVFYIAHDRSRGKKEGMNYKIIPVIIRLHR